MATWLVATDFSRCAAAAVHQAARDLALRGQGRLVVLHVFSIDYLPSQFADEHYRELIEKHVAGRLGRVRSHLVERYPSLQVDEDIREGPPAETILATASHVGAERIVVGTHSRAEREFELVGSIAQRVVRAASVPVLVVKTAENSTGLFNASQ